MIQSKNNKIIFHLLASVCFLTASSVSLHAQNSTGARSLAMGQTGTALSGDHWSAFLNVALLSTDAAHVSFYGFRYVGISEITDIAATTSYPTSAGVFAAGIHRYGFNLFNENRILAAYKNNLGRFHYGAGVSYFHVNQGGNYGSAGAVGIDIGLAAEIATGLWFGARATNLNQPSYGNTNEELPRELAAGFSYQLTPGALLTSEVVKDVMFPVSVRGGLEFEIVRSLFARAGFTTEPETYSIGFGYHGERWLINFGLQQHNPLGLSPALDFGIQF